MTNGEHRAVFLLLVMAYTRSSNGALYEHQGREFVVGFSAQHMNFRYNGTNRLYLSSDATTRVRVQAPALTLDTYISLTPGVPRHVDLPGTARMSDSTGIEKKGIRLTSSEKFAVHGMNLLKKSSEGYLGLPVSTLGTDYVISTFQPVISAILLVISPTDNTRVNIKLRIAADGQVSHGGAKYGNGDTLTIVLSTLEAFQIVTNSNEDITGTRVTSDKAVAVYSGNDCAYVPFTKGSCDHLVEQIPPVHLLDTKFITMATANRTAGDLYHIVAAYNDTVVNVDTKQETSLQAGQRYELDSQYNQSHVLVTSKPSLVVQYAKGSTVDDSLFDPFMSIVPATSQYSNDYTVFVPTHEARSFSTFVNIAADSSDFQEIIASRHQDNASETLHFTKCDVVHGTSYTTCSLELTSGSYRVYHSNPLVSFALVTYGTWQKESYGFPGGFRLATNESNCVKTKMVPADHIDNDCDGRTDEELLNNIDDDGDGEIDEDLVTRPPSINVPKNASITSCTKTNFTPSVLGSASGEAYGICHLRGPVTITFSDHFDKNECGLTLVRQWKISDACTNIKQANQYVVVKIPSKPVIDFPKDFTKSCRAKKFLTPEIIGFAKVKENPCKGPVKIRYQDSIARSCFVTKRSLVREWTAEDECGRLSTSTQTIHLLPLHGQIKTRNFNASIIIDSTVIHQNNETKTQTEDRIYDKVEMALLLSSIADVFLESDILQYRSGANSSSMDFLLRFEITSSVTARDILTNLHIATVTGLLRNVTQQASDISVEDFNECRSSKFNTCGKNAACLNTAGSYNCSCVAGFVGNGFTCYAAPTITKLEPHTEALITESVTITCEVFGVPAPDVFWEIPDGRIISRAVALRVVETLDDSTTRTRIKKQQVDGSLLITQISADDSGAYTCIAKNAYGEGRMATNLTVYKDRIMVHASITLIQQTFGKELDDRKSLRYQTLETKLQTMLSNLFVKIDGFQRVDIVKFLKGSVKVLFSVVVKISDSGDSPGAVRTKVGEALKKQVTSGKLAELEVSKTAQLRGRPLSPNNLAVSDVQSTSVMVQWDPPSLHEMYGVSLYTLQFKEFGEHIKTWKTFTSVSAPKHELSGLKTGSSYLVRVKAHNQYGSSDASDPLEIKTVKESGINGLLLLVLVPVLVLIIIIFLVVCVVRHVRKKRRGGGYDPAAQEEVAMIHLNTDNKRSGDLFRGRNSSEEDHYTGSPPSKDTLSENEIGLLSGPDANYLWRELTRDQIVLGEVIGEGEFGLVYKGTMKEENGQEIPCAVKKLKGSATETDLKNLLNELDIMAGVGKHENVINLIGACPTGGPILAVVEYAEHGNLLRYLRRHRRQNYNNINDYSIAISPADRLKFAGEISKGMAHLAAMKCIHRDLAARNVLLGEGLVAKVSDFGLSRDVYADNVYEKKTGGKLPARWMAIESLALGMYTSQSDVWSFGVVLWEIETGGVTPFASSSVEEIMQHLKAARRLGRPNNCDRTLYSIMLRCWNANPQERPTFEQLTRKLDDLRYRQTTMYTNVPGTGDDNMNEQNEEKC